MMDAMMSVLMVFYDGLYDYSYNGFNDGCNKMSSQGYVVYANGF